MQNYVAICLHIYVQSMVQFNLNFTNECRHMHVAVHLPHVKVQNSACARHVTRRFSVCTNAHAHQRRTNEYACHERMICMHYTCAHTYTSRVTCVYIELDRFW